MTRVLLACGVGLLALAGLQIVSAERADATAYTYSTTVNLDPADLYGGDGYLQYFSGTPSMTLSSGDTISGTILFGNGSVSVRNAANTSPNWIDFAFFGNGGTIFTSTVQFLGVTGTLGSANPHSSTMTYGNSVLGADVDGVLAAQDFSFTGIEYTIDISNITDNDTNEPGSVPFNFGAIDIRSGHVGLDVATVPEPASLTLLGMGIAGIGLLRRRRGQAPAS